MLLDCLADRMLWDRDVEMDEQLDVDPQAGHRVTNEQGIDSDYFTAAPARSKRRGNGKADR